MGDITLHVDGALATLQLANPGKANALSLRMLGQLHEHLRALQGDTRIRVVLMRGTPGGTFSSGADIADWSPMPPEQFAAEWIAHGNAIFDRLEQLHCPTVAAVEGLCFGGGLELALCADLRVGSGAARFRFPEVGIGAIPGWQGGERLARIAGRGRALEAVLTGCEIHAEAAERWGLLNAQWQAADFEIRLTEFIGALTRASPTAARWAKAAIVGRHEAGSDAARDFHHRASLAVKGSPDAAIGIQAFFAKKPATF